MATDAAARVSVLRLSFFLLFYLFLFYIFRIRADSAPIRAKLGRFGQNWVVSAELDCIGRQPKLTETAETG